MLSFGKWFCCFGSSISTDEWSHMIYSGLSMSRRQVYEYIASAKKFCNCLFLLRIEVLNPKCRAYSRNGFNSCGVSSRFSSANFSKRAKFGNKSRNSLATETTLNFSGPCRRVRPAKLTNHSARTNLEMQ